MRYKKTILSNKLRILTIPMQNTQTLTVIIMVGTGSRFESSKEAGISHFLEHMLFKGTPKRPTFHDIASELDAVGGEFNAFTTKDKTAYWTKASYQHGKITLDVIADVFLNAKLDPAEIEKEKGAIIQEINMYEDTPRAQVIDIFEGLLFQKSSLGRKIIGDRQTVRSFQRKNLNDYQRRHYVAANTVIAVAGRFEEKIFLEDIRQMFAGLKKGQRPLWKRTNVKQNQAQLRIKRKKTDQTHVVLGVPAYHQDHPDRFALGLLAIILGGNSSSRLFQEIREKRGLAYSVHTGTEFYADSGYLATHTGTAHDKLEEVVSLILEEYKKVSLQKISEEELRRAKEYVKGSSLMNLESSDEVAIFHLDQEIRRGRIMTVEQIFSQIEKVSTADILRVATDLFQERKLNLAIIGPRGNSHGLKNILKL